MSRLAWVCLVCGFVSGMASAQQFLSSTEFAVPPETAVPVARKLVLLADLQEHEEAGKPVLAATSAVDMVIRPTIRPAEQTLFASTLARIAVQSAADPILVLGDVLDISCESEWRRVRSVLMSGPQPVVIAPGNHDGFYMGNFAPTEWRWQFLIGQYGWDARCERAGRYADGTRAEAGRNRASFLDKSGYLKQYLAAIRERQDTDAALLECLQAVGDAGAQVACQAADPSAFLQAVAARIYREGISGSPFYKSFLIQKVGLSSPGGLPAAVYVLDTSQYGQGCVVLDCKYGQLAGVAGNIAADQFDALESLLASAPEGEIRIFAGHHPLSDWSAAARDSLFEILGRRPGAYVYLSAHTHKGSWFDWLHESTRVVELNTGSLIDAPIYFRSFAVLRDGVDGTTYVESVPYVASPTSEQDGGPSVDWLGRRWDCRQEWIQDVAGRPFRNDFTVGMRGSWESVLKAQLWVLRDQLEKAYALPTFVYSRWNKDGSLYEIEPRPVDEIRSELTALIEQKPYLSTKKRRTYAANAGEWIAQLQSARVPESEFGTVERYQVCKAVYSASADASVHSSRHLKKSVTESFGLHPDFLKTHVRLERPPTL